MVMMNQTRKDHRIVTTTTCLSGVLATFMLAFAVQVIFFSPIEPHSMLEFVAKRSCPTLAIPLIGEIKEVTKLGEGVLTKPEDVAIDKEGGALYTATRDGFVKKLHKNGTWEDIWHAETDGLLGLTVTPSGDVIVCHADEGLFRVSAEGSGATLLASHVNGDKIRFADDVIASMDGTMYLSVASTKFGLHDWPLDVLEARPHGQLLKYDHTSKEATILLDNLGFANGVALSEGEDFLIVCETWKFRCLKYWLKGDLRGTTEIFVENLPGGPDNINLAADGSFWIALLDLVPDDLRFLHSSKALKHFVAAFPSLRMRALGVHRRAMAVKVSPDGELIRGFEDPKGREMAFVTSALEFEDHLYFGSLHNNFIGKLPLTE